MAKLLTTKPFSLKTANTLYQVQIITLNKVIPQSPNPPDQNI